MTSCAKQRATSELWYVGTRPDGEPCSLVTARSQETLQAPGASFKNKHMSRAPSNPDLRKLNGTKLQQIIILHRGSQAQRFEG